jgi:hypothetical protein
VEEVLFSRCEYEIRAAIDAFENAVLKLRHGVFPVDSVSKFVKFGRGYLGPARTCTLGSGALFDFPA